MGFHLPTCLLQSVLNGQSAEIFQLQCQLSFMMLEGEDAKGRGWPLQHQRQSLASYDQRSREPCLYCCGFFELFFFPVCVISAFLVPGSLFMPNGNLKSWNASPQWCHFGRGMWEILHLGCLSLFFTSSYLSCGYEGKKKKKQQHTRFERSGKQESWVIGPKLTLMVRLQEMGHLWGQEKHGAMLRALRGVLQLVAAVLCIKSSWRGL